MADVRVTYDKAMNAAYVYFTDPQGRAKAARMYPCDPAEVGGMTNLDFDKQGCLIGIEVLAASSRLPKYPLKSAERVDNEGACMNRHWMPRWRLCKPGGSPAPEDARGDLP
ncbi:DUF2283 domain-containing protein [Streptomyces sp. NPDC048496]|uniref:DUF2283 domain-containing protein n=1 Tax=Streptomyces sp. NPDC048496 TaxID=3365558 RepID=UPI00371682CA